MRPAEEAQNLPDCLLFVVGLMIPEQLFSSCCRVLEAGSIAKRASSAGLRVKNVKVKKREEEKFPYSSH